MKDKRKPLNIKIFEKMLKKDATVTTQTLKKDFDIPVKFGISVLQKLEENNFLINKYESHKGKLRFYQFSIHKEKNLIYEKELETFKNMLSRFTIIDQQFKTLYKQKLGITADKYEDGRFYARKAKKLGFISKIMNFDVQRTVILKNKDDLESIEFKRFISENKESKKEDIKTDFSKDIQLFEFPIFNKINSEISPFEEQILKYLIFPSSSIPNDNLYPRTFDELKNNFIKLLEKHKNLEKEIKINEDFFLNLSVYEIFQIYPISLRRGADKLLLEILKYSFFDDRMAEIILNTKNQNEKISNSRKDFTEQIKEIFFSDKQIFDFLNEKNMEKVFTEISLKNIFILSTKIRKSRIVIHLKHILKNYLMLKVENILKILEIEYKKENLNILLKNEKLIKNCLVDQKINQAEFDKQVKSNFQYLNKPYLNVNEKINFYKKLNLKTIDTFKESFKNAIYSSTYKTIDSNDYWKSKFRILKIKSNIEIPELKTKKLNSKEEKNLFKIKKYILKNEKLPNLNNFLQNKSSQLKILRELKNKKILIEKENINPSFFVFKYEKIKNSVLPFKKLNDETDAFTKNIFYFLLKKGSLSIKNIQKEIEFLSAYEIRKIVKKSKLFIFREEKIRGNTFSSVSLNFYKNYP